GQIQDVQNFRLLKNEGCYQYSDSIKMNNNGYVQFDFTTPGKAFTAELRINLASHADQVLFSQMHEFGSIGIGCVGVGIQDGYHVSIFNDTVFIKTYAPDLVLDPGCGYVYIQRSAIAYAVLPVGNLLPLDIWKHLAI